MVAIVVAYARDGVIGREGTLPWRLPSDMRHFRELTSEGTVLMGRRTFESIPERFRPLPQRRNLVLSSNRDYAPDGAEAFADLPAALAACGDECFVIGGETVYRETLPLAERVYATEIEERVRGDTYFPVLASEEWRCIERSEALRENGHSFSFCVYEHAS
jgi:dihydrofolate reductase